jgi:hypothetical protein
MVTAIRRKTIIVATVIAAFAVVAVALLLPVLANASMKDCKLLQNSRLLHHRWFTQDIDD